MRLFSAASRILTSYKKQIEILQLKRATLNNIEDALGPAVVEQMKQECDKLGQGKFRPRVIDLPSKSEVLKKIHEEEIAKARVISPHSVSVRMSGSLGINMGLELEMKQ
jgi:hypothetical protein